MKVQKYNEFKRNENNSILDIEQILTIPRDEGIEAILEIEDGKNCFIEINRVTFDDTISNGRVLCEDITKFNKIVCNVISRIENIIGENKIAVSSFYRNELTHKLTPYTARRFKYLMLPNRNDNITSIEENKDDVIKYDIMFSIDVSSPK
jgi:hypothetical protein